MNTEKKSISNAEKVEGIKDLQGLKASLLLERTSLT